MINKFLADFKKQNEKRSGKTYSSVVKEMTTQARENKKEKGDVTNRYDATLKLNYGDMLVLRRCVQYAMKFDKSATNKQVLEEMHLKITLALEK